MSTSAENLTKAVASQEDYVKSLERQIADRNLTGRETQFIQGFLDKALFTLVVLRSQLKKTRKETHEDQ